MTFFTQIEGLKVQLEAIKSATNNFAEENCIGKGGFGKVYKGDLVNLKGRTMVALKRLDRAFGQGDREFWNEILTLSLYSHENIVSLLGFCDDSGEKILIYQYASKNGLDLHLESKDLTWFRRLQICIQVARGLAYLHRDVGTQQRVVHRDVKSSNILLDKNWNARIADFGLSKFCPVNIQYPFLFTYPVGTAGYCDPLFSEIGLLTKEADVYSFGVVLFEVLCGRLCNGNDDKHESFTQLVRRHFNQRNIDEIICGKIKDEIHPSSLKVFATIAYQCLNIDHEKRPIMEDIVTKLESALQYQVTPPPHVMELFGQPEDDHLSTTNTTPTFMNKFEHLGVPLEFIKHATNNFHDSNVMIQAGYGRLYRAEFFHSKGRTMGIVKRLNPTNNQVDSVFLWREVMLLSGYRHENIISLLGFCNESGETMIVYEFTSNKSLDFHLVDPNFTWIQRLKICLGVARGLEYLHRPKGTQQRVLHCDIKSSNIFLDENWNAKITNFYISEYGPSNKEDAYFFTRARGTPGYCDPMFGDMSLLTRESDIYSFGVVLFEVLCSRPCADYSYKDARRSLPILVNKYFQKQRLDMIIDVNLRKQIEQKSFDKFTTLALQCLESDRTCRPSMNIVVSKLETALEYQEGRNILTGNVNMESSSRPLSASDDNPKPENQVDPETKL